jgi:hypothetical protein
MKDQFEDRVHFLANYADKKAISWQEDARELPQGDNLALIGLLADRIGIPFQAAMDETVTEKDLRILSGEEVHHG